RPQHRQAHRPESRGRCPRLVAAGLRIDVHDPAAGGERTRMTRILIVEDELSLAEPLAFLLQREGYETEIVTDGPAALTAFDRSGPDLVLLDLMLPGIPGTEVCRELRARSNVPIIMLTAKDTEVDIVVGLELGADD